VTVTGAGSCPCHPDINEAIHAHRPIVETLARALGTRPGRDGYDDVISDGMLALWRALATYDPARERLDTWLTRRVRFRMIDGLRSRGGRGAATKPATHTLLDADLELVADKDELMDDRVNTAVDAGAETGQLYMRAAAIDSRLPRILDLLSQGYNRTEVAMRLGVSRTRVWQLTTLLIKPPAPRPRRPEAAGDPPARRRRSPPGGDPAAPPPRTCHRQITDHLGKECA
jgi:RNA polymerase sigma factor (sigma-70 family)